MTKRRSSTSKKASSSKRTTRRSSSKRSSRKKKGSSGFSLGGLILLVLIVGGLFLTNRLGLTDIDLQALLDDLVAGDAEQGQVANAPPEEPVIVEPVTGEWYQLYFTSPQYPDEPETRVDTMAQGLISAINSAQTTLDIAIYELNLDHVGDAILAARDRGVRVRIVTDTDELEELETLIRLEAEGIPIVADERSAIMHDKFVVVDGRAVWTGSWNFTPNGTYRNNNNAIYIQSPELAQNYAAEFEEMFTEQAFGPTSPFNTLTPQIQIGDTLIETCFSPEDACADKVVEIINQAENSIRFMAFAFTHDGIGQAVRERAKAGVTVRGIFETRGSETEFSEFGPMKRQGLDVVQDGNPYTFHHKVFITDDETVILGSMNFSDNAAKSNDENILVIHNPDIAAQFVAEFDRTYAQAKTAQN